MKLPERPERKVTNSEGWVVLCQSRIDKSWGFCCTVISPSEEDAEEMKSFVSGDKHYLRTVVAPIVLPKYVEQV